MSDETRIATCSRCGGEVELRRDNYGNWDGFCENCVRQTLARCNDYRERNESDKTRRRDALNI